MVDGHQDNLENPGRGALLLARTATRCPLMRYHCEMILHIDMDAGLELLCKRLPKNHLPVRLIGFGVSNLDQPEIMQLQLFDESEREQQRSLDKVADEIAKKFGKHALHRAVGIRKSADPS